MKLRIEVDRGVKVLAEEDTPDGPVFREVATVEDLTLSSVEAGGLELAAEALRRLAQRVRERRE